MPVDDHIDRLSRVADHMRTTTEDGVCIRTFDGKMIETAAHLDDLDSQLLITVVDLLGSALESQPASTRMYLTPPQAEALYHRLEGFLGAVEISRADMDRVLCERAGQSDQGDDLAPA